MKNREDHFFKTIARISGAIYLGHSTDMILQMTADSIGALFHTACGCSLRALNRESNLLELQNAVGMRHRYLPKGYENFPFRNLKSSKNIRQYADRLHRGHLALDKPFIS